MRGGFLCVKGFTNHEQGIEAGISHKYAWRIYVKFERIARFAPDGANAPKNKQKALIKAF